MLTARPKRVQTPHVHSMNRSYQFTPKKILRGGLIAIFPWLPAYLFERMDFYFGQTIHGFWYYEFSGLRLEADVVSFALGGILIAYLLRPRWAMAQVFLSAVLIYVLFYVACPTYQSGTIWQSECYQQGPDGLAGIRLTMMMFSFGALPTLAKVASKGEGLDRRLSPAIAIFAGIVVTVVMTWFPLTAWFSGVTYLSPLAIFQALILAGVPQLETGILTASIGRSLKIATASGVISLLFISGALGPLLCPGCDRSLLYLLVPAWAFFAFLGGLTVLGYPRLRFHGLPAWFGRIKMESVRRVGVALVLAVCLMTLVAWDYWDPSVLFATSISPGQGNLTLGLPNYPYIAGYYNSSQYRICCVEIGVSFAKANPQLLAPDNFLMAGMGVQSPNCCIDGWDFGWRADVFLLPNSSLVVSGSSWGTCDSNANCGGHFWQYLRYHTEVTISPANISTPIFLRMMWESGRANWYYNTTGVPWTKFGSFNPDFREGRYFDIGIPGGVASNIPQGLAIFYQFGVATKFPVPGWSVLLLYPSFQYQGSWRKMEKANVIQGDFSYWKAVYRWGGAPYAGVTARANALNPSMPSGMVQFSYTGGTLKDYSPLW